MEKESYAKKNQYEGKALDHLGLIADKIDDLNLISLIDERLPIQEGVGSKVSMGERVAAMILNGLGFVDARLYMFPKFLEKKPVQRLFGKALDAEWFNDDALGRCLDAISEYGSTKLFTELSFIIGTKKKLLGRSAHFDTSTLQLWGEYEVSSCSANAQSTSDSPSIPTPKHGYSKSHRHDLKQMVINLATTGQSNFPIWMESHSGNASDKKILPSAAARMKEFCQKLEEAPDFLFVGDSAMYSNVLKYSDQFKWLTRVPENILPAKKLVRSDDSVLDWKSLSNGYSYHVTESDYKGVKQRWVMIFSKHAYEREIKTVEKNIEKERIEQQRAWKRLSHEIFSCPEDAKKACERHASKMKYHSVQRNIIAFKKYANKGRPKQGEEPSVQGYKINYTFLRNEESINALKRRKGRFILSSNELEDQLADHAFLEAYKAQSGTESSFKFIKDKTFEVDSIFLKTAARIEALMMIMTFCLMVYGVSQYDLRIALKKASETIPNQQDKPTDTPSMKWVYFIFLGAHELSIHTRGTCEKIVINVTPVMEKILKYCGVRAQEAYFAPS